jgi:ferredoxin
MSRSLPPFYLRLRFATSAISSWVLNLGMFGQRFKLKSTCSPGFNCHGCPWASAACPIGAIAYGSAVHAIPVFAIASVLAMAAVFGRLICAFACPFGLLQDLLYRLPSPKLRLPRFFRYGKYLALILLVLALPWALGFAPSGFLRVAKPEVNKNAQGNIDVTVAVTNLGGEPVNGVLLGAAYRDSVSSLPVFQDQHSFPQVSVLPGQTVTLPVFAVPNKLAQANLLVDSPQSVPEQQPRWELYYCKLCPCGTLTATLPAIAGAGASTMYYRVAHNALRLGILIVFLILMVIASRPFCRLFCPLGAIYALTTPLSLSGMAIHSDACIDCGKCDEVCPVGLDVRREVGSAECIACGDCKKVCPQHGIYRTYGLGRSRQGVTLPVLHA